MSGSALRKERTTTLVEQPREPIASARLAVLVQGAIFGFTFGFLLQKGGVGKFDILIGQLLFLDFTVAKVMLSAIIVGMIGIFSMHAAGIVELQVKSTRYLSNTLGGLIFGAGFALMGYCPGTGLAALGQGNLDAMAGIFGLLFGSYIFALGSRSIFSKVDKVGVRGKVMLPDLIGVRVYPFMIVFIPLLLLLAWKLEWLRVFQ